MRPKGLPKEPNIIFIQWNKKDDSMKKDYQFYTKLPPKDRPGVMPGVRCPVGYDPVGYSCFKVKQKPVNE